MKKINEKLLSWASIIEPNTLEQARLTASMPFVFPHLALMPDAHLGKGATVGSVIPTMGAIMPAAVGVDIGCGMMAVRLNLTVEHFIGHRGASLARLREMIEQAVPLSAGNYNTTLTESAQQRIGQLEDMAARDHRFDPGMYGGNWRYQLGTLGSGNHFIEVTVDELNNVWLFLHSGSRGVGNKIAQKYIKLAQEECRKWWIELPHPDLAYLVEGSVGFWEYIRELLWAQNFARLNREEMMDRVLRCVAKWMDAPVSEEQRVQCHHNYTEREHIFGKRVWLSRKGAIDASEGVFGLIPGSMGTASYIVVGKGNRLSFNSAPHGAGRNHSRSAARKKFTQEDLRKSMEGIEYRDTDAFIDEIPSAYKPIDQVMADASDLVEIKHTLHQIVNVKGD